MLSPGTKLDPGSLQVHEVASTIPIEVTKRVAAVPYGEVFEGRQGSVRLMLTVYEPELLTSDDDRARLRGSLNALTGLRHEKLLSTYGSIDMRGTLVAVREHPGRASLRRFIDRRKERGKAIAPHTALGILVEVAHGLSKLHPDSSHGFFHAGNVYLGKDGSVKVGGLGELPLLRHGQVMREAYTKGMLPMPPPELRGGSPRPSPASDAYLLASLFSELMTGKPTSGVGDPLDSLPGNVVPALRELMRSCLVADPRARPMDAYDFLERLAVFQKVGASTNGASAGPREGDAPSGTPQPITDGNSTDQWMTMDALAPLDGPAAPPTPGAPLLSDAPTLDAGASTPGGALDELGGLGGLGGLDEVGGAPAAATPTVTPPATPAPGHAPLLTTERPSIAAGGAQFETADLGGGPSIGLDLPDANARLVVSVNGIDEGPFELDVIEGMIREGKIGPDTLVGVVGEETRTAGTHPATAHIWEAAAGSTPLLETHQAPAGPPTDSQTMSLLPDEARRKIGLASVRASAPGSQPGSPPGDSEHVPAATLDPVDTSRGTPAPQPSTRPISPASAHRASPRAGAGTRAAGTLGWIFMTLVLFAATAWVMWQRQGGGG